MLKKLFFLSPHKQSEEKLRQVAQALKTSQDELEQFIYISSHDLRAPLINLRGFTAELEAALNVVRPAVMKHIAYCLDSKERTEVMQALEQDIPEAVAFIYNTVKRMDTMTNAMLELSRIGRRELKFIPVHVSELVAHCLGTFQHQIKARNVTVQVGGLPDLYADYVSLQQIFSNIFDNAIKYLEPDRPGKLRIRGWREGTNTIYAIDDNGRGIPQEDMPRVFQIFRRVGDCQNIPGDGMGMAYVKALVKRHHGDLWCESRFGEGTCFYLRIPDLSAKGEESDEPAQYHTG